LGDRFVELPVASDVQRAEPLDEPVQVLHHRVAEDLLGAVLVRARDPLREVRDQAGELVDEGLLGQPDGLLEARPDPLLLPPVEVGCELDQVVGRVDRWEVPGDAEEAPQRRGSRPG
jgi:hypothetical protein